MSCPYFYPQTPSPKPGSKLARIPLGVLYQGDCLSGLLIRNAVEDGWCNFGYGRGSCSNFPQDAEADAVRFTLSNSGQLVWILEKDFAPIHHGSLDSAGAVVKRQAEVFLENYGRHITRTQS